MVLLLSAVEVRDLLAGKPSTACTRHIKSQLKLEELLPDDDLPHALVIERLDDTYACTYRCYDDPLSAERAIMRLTAADRERALAVGDTA